MDVMEICRRGYFDKVTINCVMEPLYGEDTELFSDMSFGECIENEYNMIDRAIFKVRLNIMGVECIKKQCTQPDELDAESKRGTKLYKVGFNNEKSYVIAYADLIVLVLKPNESPKTKKEIERRFGSQPDETLLLLTANQLQPVPHDKSSVSVIVDRVYVYPVYRRCGISGWFHRNIRDVLYNYLDIEVGNLLLIPGDFARESQVLFNMSDEEYKNMLTKHYSSLGYQKLKSGVMINKPIRAKVVKKINRLKDMVFDKLNM